MIATIIGITVITVTGITAIVVLTKWGAGR
jgi:hypothetical protein